MYDYYEEQPEELSLTAIVLCVLLAPAMIVLFILFKG